MHHEKQLRLLERKCCTILKKYGIDLVVIGNGTASRETESFIAKLIREEKCSNKIFDCK